MWRWLSSNEIKLVASSAHLCSQFCRRDKSDICQNPHFPSSLNPPHSRLKPRKSKADIFKVWISPEHTVRLSTNTILQQGPRRVSREEGETGSSLRQPDPRAIRSFTVALSFLLGLHLNPRFLTHRLQDTKNNISFSAFFPQEWHKSNGALTVRGHAQAFSGRVLRRENQALPR